MRRTWFKEHLPLYCVLRWNFPNFSRNQRRPSTSIIFHPCFLAGCEGVRIHGFWRPKRWGNRRRCRGGVEVEQKLTYKTLLSCLSHGKFLENTLGPKKQKQPYKTLLSWLYPRWGSFGENMRLMFGFWGKTLRGKNAWFDEHDFEKRQPKMKII